MVRDFGRVLEPSRFLRQRALGIPGWPGRPGRAGPGRVSINNSEEVSSEEVSGFREAQVPSVPRSHRSPQVIHGAPPRIPGNPYTDIHIWISIYGYPYMGSQGSLGGNHGYLGGTDGTLGSMGPWDRWDLGLKDLRYLLRVVLSIPGPARLAGPARLGKGTIAF